MSSMSKYETISALCVVFCLAAQAPADDWPVFHGDPALTGFTRTQLPRKPRPLWRYNAGAGVTATPVSGGGRIYAATGKGAIKALTYEGGEIWSREFAYDSGPEIGSRPEIFQAPPVYVSGMVVIGGASGIVYAVDPGTGEVKWRYETGDAIQGTAIYWPAKDGTRVAVIGQPTGVIYCLDAATGKEVWVSDETARTDGHMAVSDGKIAFGNCSAGFDILSAADGSHLGNIPVGSGMEMAGGTAILAGMAVSGNRSGSIAAANLETLTLAWTNAVSSGELFTTPALTDEYVVFASGAGDLVCSDRKTGKVLWKKEVDGHSPTSPIVAGSEVIAAIDGKLFIVDLKTGKDIWMHDLGDRTSSPAVIEGMLVIGTAEGYIMAFGSREAEKTKPKEINE